MVRLSKNFLTHRAPELYVYLVKLRGQQRVEWKQVGTLRQFWGRQAYAMPKLTASDLTAQVAIYCVKCNKFSSLAQLAPASWAFRSTTRPPPVEVVLATGGGRRTLDLV